MNCFSFLPSTCVAMIDLMSEQLINIEYQRFKDVLSVLSVSTPSKTTNKTTTRSDRKREVLKTALLQIISQEHRKENKARGNPVNVKRYKGVSFYYPNQTNRQGSRN